MTCVTPSPSTTVVSTTGPPPSPPRSLSATDASSAAPAAAAADDDPPADDGRLPPPPPLPLALWCPRSARATSGVTAEASMPPPPPPAPLPRPLFEAALPAAAPDDALYGDVRFDPLSGAGVFPASPSYGAPSLRPRARDIPNVVVAPVPCWRPLSPSLCAELAGLCGTSASTVVAEPSCAKGEAAAHADNGLAARSGRLCN